MNNKKEQTQRTINLTAKAQKIVKSRTNRIISPLEVVKIDPILKYIPVSKFYRSTRL